MGKRRATSGFTLIEMAVVLIIIGVISAVLTPVIMRTISREKVAAGRGNLQAYVDRVIGYAVAGGISGTLPTSPFGGDVDMWGKSYTYLPFGSTAICATTSTTLSVTDGTSTLSDIAFVVTSAGPNGAAAIVPATSTTVSIPDDDLYQYVTLYELKALMCQANNTSTTPEDTTGDSEASKYVIYSSGGGYTVQQNAIVTGAIAADGDITLDNNANVTGDVGASGDVTLENNSIVTGDIYSNGNISIASGVHVTGDIHAQGTVTVASNAIVTGNIYANGVVSIDTGAQITGAINTGGNLVVDHQAVISGDITTSGSVTVDQQTHITGTVNAGGDVYLARDVILTGTVITSGSVTLDQSARITGDAHAGTTIYVGRWASIAGAAYAASSITKHFQGTIGSQHPYSPAPPRLTPSSPTAPTAYVPPATPKEKTPLTAGGADQTLIQNQSLPLAPGTYGTLSFAGNNVLTLSGGDYFFDAIASTGNNLSLYLNLASNATINIFVVGNVVLPSNPVVYVSTNGATYNIASGVDQNYAANVYAEAHGTWTMGSNTNWFGTFFSRGNIAFGSENSVIGAYYTAGIVTMTNNVNLTYVQSAYARDHW
ncbi:MAG: polymer-forming cytoskeletal protein [Desulfovibrionaceae bacterium]